MTYTKKDIKIIIFCLSMMILIIMFSVVNGKCREMEEIHERQGMEEMRIVKTEKKVEEFEKMEDELDILLQKYNYNEKEKTLIKIVLKMSIKEESNNHLQNYVEELEEIGYFDEDCPYKIDVKIDRFNENLTYYVKKNKQVFFTKVVENCSFYLQNQF